ncbi:MAG: hypothetical protein LBS15_01830 [Endomicrobium sp.]|nr:hypothetical protein [Endomicrobium sp.]
MSQEIAKIEAKVINNDKSLQLLKIKQKEINEAIVRGNEEVKIFNSDFARGPISNLIIIDKSKHELIASTLGEKLNYLVCETLEKAEDEKK